jgi:hypothetical protein
MISAQDVFTSSAASKTIVADSADDPVTRTAATRHEVVPKPTVRDVFTSRPPIDPVVASVAEDSVHPSSSKGAIAPVLPLDQVVPRSRVDPVAASVTVDAIVAFPSADPVVAAASMDGVASVPGNYYVGRRSAPDVRSTRLDNDRRLSAEASRSGGRAGGCGVSSEGT